MRTLKFIIDKQIIKQDPECDFSDIVPGTKGYLIAEFSFSHEWNNTIRVAEFWSNNKECTPQLLYKGKSCIIPAEALLSKRFSIRIIGKNKDLIIKTNKVEICQNGR